MPRDSETWDDDVRKTYSSEWMNAEDLQEGKEYTVTIENVTRETITDSDTNKDKVMVALWFVGAKKAYLPNKTMRNYLGDQLGLRMNNWVGKKIVLYTEWVQFGKNRVRGIRVRARKDLGGPHPL